MVWENLGFNKIVNKTYLKKKLYLQLTPFKHIKPIILELLFKRQFNITAVDTKLAETCVNH